MKEFDNHDVPTAAFIEHFILMRAYDQGALSRPSLEVCLQFKVEDELCAPFVQIRILSLLYCLLVFPSELWRRRERIEAVLARAKLEADVNPRVRPILSTKFLRHLRNAVSHSRIRFVEGGISFCDVDRRGKIHFQEDFSYEDILNLLLVLGRAFSESRDDMRLLN